MCCAGGNIGCEGISGAKAGKPTRDDALSVTHEDFATVMDVNLMTAVNCCQVRWGICGLSSSFPRHLRCSQAVVPDMISRRYGRVILIGSVAGCQGRADGVAYATAKGSHYVVPDVSAVPVDAWLFQPLFMSMDDVWRASYGHATLRLTSSHPAQRSPNVSWRIRASILPLWTPTPGR